MCSSYRILSAHSGGVAGFVLSLSKLSCTTGMPSLIRMSQEKVYPSLTMRASDGLSWDSPAGIELSKVVPRHVEDIAASWVLLFLGEGISFVDRESL